MIHLSGQGWPAFPPLHRRITDTNSITVKGIKMKFCIKCQVVTERDISGRCKPCRSVYSAKHYKENIHKERERSAMNRHANLDKARDRERRSSAKYYALNADLVRERQSTYRNSNREMLRERMSKWKRKNPEKVRINWQNRRAMKVVNGGRLSACLADKLLKLQRGKCACCGLSLGNNYHLDHIMPLALGGTNTDDNIQLLRSECNMQKNAKHPVDFMRQRGFLL